MARKILLADDSVTAQNMGRKILTDAGYEVVTVNNGSAALKKIGEDKPALVVLDVYMPGYSGLEVCQRVKEGKDTAGIPVLLTVGKLEPFKQDDARKVHADAFIIKPFEATELLAAVSKLEAKLGAVTDSGKTESAKPETGKKARGSVATMERYERLVADGEPQFGDRESGWKARLPLPVAGKDSHDGDDQTIPADEESSNLSRQSMNGAFPEAVAHAAGVAEFPKDVTPAELAAIAAAAAAVGDGASGPREFEQVHPVKDMDAASSASKIDGSENSTPVSAELPVATRVSSTEINAGLTSFAPAMSVPEPATASLASSHLPAAGTRWVAEEVPVEAKESELILEREMQKAFAAFAAAESGSTYEPGPGGNTGEPVFASMAPPPIGDPTPFADASQSSHESVSENRLTDPVPAPEDHGHGEIASEMPRPPLVAFTPPTFSMDESQHAISAFGNPHPFGASETPETVEEGKPEAGPENTPAVSEFRITPEPVPVTEKPATWADWHDIREAEAGNSASAKSTPEIEAAMAAAASANSSSSPAEPNLSNIVDSMLAELKPKLMAELAKKLEKK